MYKISYISNEIMWLLLNANTAHFQPYHDENKLWFNEMVTMYSLYYTSTLSGIFIVLAHWNNIPRIYMLSTRTHYPDS